MDMPSDVMSWLLENVFLQPCLPNEQSIWRLELDVQARQNPYLISTASSIFALYKSFQAKQGSSELRAHAYQYNIEASNMFRGSRPVITEQNWLAVMSFGIGIMIFQFGTAELIQGQELSYYLDMFHLLRHTCTLTSSVVSYWVKSPLSSFVERRQSLLQCTLDEPTWHAIQQLNDVPYMDDEPEYTRQACRRAIEALQEWTMTTDGHPRFWQHFMMWQGAVSDTFADLLVARHHVALLVLVYW
jgi:hypothetical protein